MIKWTDIHEWAEAVVRRLLGGLADEVSERGAGTLVREMRAGSTEEVEEGIVERLRDSGRLYERMALCERYDYKKAYGKLKAMERRRRKLRRLGVWSGVAACFAAVGLFALSEWEQEEPRVAQRFEPVREVKAILVRADGERYRLDAKEQRLKDGDGVSLSTDSTGLRYEAKEGKTAVDSAAGNSLLVPRGGVYNLTLADGTRVWLNSDSRLDYPENMRTGRYAVHPGMSNLALLNDLRRGHQVATQVTFNNIRLKEELAERIDRQLMLSKADLLYLLNDSVYCDSLGFTVETILTLFLPNTYEVYWNLSARRFMSRMKREYDAFWNAKRLEKARNAGLTPVEVSILASIVEEETAVPDEYPVVAGLYINRLRAGIPLQADPTVKFAVGDFSLRRILFEHLEVDSPYNTYKHTGLPPGPLRIPSIESLEGVLNYARHRYFYMCAKEDLSGRHNFAKTLAEHNRNAHRYQSELNRRKIR